MAKIRKKIGLFLGLQKANGLVVHVRLKHILNTYQIYKYLEYITTNIFQANGKITVLIASINLDILIDIYYLDDRMPFYNSNF